LKQEKPKYLESFKAISYLLHPVAIPLIAVVLYFVVNPHFVPTNNELAIVASVFILTYLIPIISIFLLLNVGLISSIHLSKIKDRKRPLIILIMMHMILLIKVLNPASFYELYYFFMGVVLALSIVYLLLFLNKKISLHLLAMGGLIGFFLVISVLHGQNYLFLIALFVFLSGVVATSRLLLNAHSNKELIVGFTIGLLSQLLVFYFHF
jgi:hypothetical protein